MKLELKVKKTDPDAKIPCYSHPGDAGMDLFSLVDEVIQPGEAKPIPTGIQMAIPKDHVGLIWDKSGVSLRGVHRLAGVVDAGYRGEVRVVMANLGQEPYVIKKGMKIAQMIIQPVEAVAIVEAEELGETPRGKGGFGSTGPF